MLRDTISFSTLHDLTPPWPLFRNHAAIVPKLRNLSSNFWDNIAIAHKTYGAAEFK